MTRAALLVLAVLSTAQSRPALTPDPPRVCDSCDEWNRPQEPFKLFGNTYYVGTAGLSALLIATSDGLILLDGGLPQSAPVIDDNIRALGYRTADIRWIVNSHAHYDHAGGIAALQRASGARVAASPSGARALQQGEPTQHDPQYAFGRAANSFPPVENVRVIAHGDVLRVGDAEITAHFTPGHTPGSTTWTWRACEETRCLDLVYADSLTAVSAPGFRFTGDDKHPPLVEAFRRSIDTIERLPCDLMVSTHPGFSGLHDKLAARTAGRPDAFVDPDSCRRYAQNARKALAARIAEEMKTK